MNSFSVLTKALSFTALAFTVAFGQTFTGRVGASHDGNQHDYDDIGAAAWDIGIFAKAGARLVHVDYSNHLADNNTGMEAKQKASVEGSAQRWYGSTAMCYNDQTNLQGAINNIAAQINASSASNRFYFLCAGPMEVPYRGIMASDQAKRQYCTAISHSTWNDDHTSSLMTHKWSSIQGSGVNAVHIADQNAKLNNKTTGAWDWAKNSSDEKLRFMWDRMANYGVYGDISDAGMAWYVITGLTDQGCTMDKLKNFFGSGSTNTPPLCSFASPVNGANFTAPASIKVKVNASDAGGSVSKVDLYKNNALVRAESVSPYEWNNTNQDAALQNLAAGTYVLKAIATDNLGATTTSSITITVGGGTAPVLIQAESYSSMSGVQKETCSEGGQNIGYINNGDWIALTNVNCGTGATSFRARVASATSGGSIEVRLDNLTGTRVGTCAVAGTGGWQTWTTKSCAISNTSGTHTLYLKFTGGSGYLFNINWVSLSGGSLSKKTGQLTIDGTNQIKSTGICGLGGGVFAISASQGAQYRILDLSGKLVRSGILTGYQDRVDLSTVNKGIYVAKITLQGQNTVQRFMVK